MIIVLYVMDSLRPDFLSCYGYSKETSPNIDRLAQEGVLFENAFAQSTWTRSSAASLLSSTYPSVHGLISLKDHLPKAVPVVSEHLRRKDFKTVAFSTMANVSSMFGFDRGFDHFVELFKEETIKKKRKVVTPGQRPVCTSEDINEFLIPFLIENRNQSMFIFIWSIDTHNPYFHRDVGLARFCSPSPEIWWAKDVEKMDTDSQLLHLRELYADMIYYNDHHLGRLVEALKELGLFQECLFILTSDHGEAFGEHGLKGHGNPPYEEQIRVPLIMKFPHSEFGGRNSALIQHIDVVPTILDYLEEKQERRLVQGRSLLSLIKQGQAVNDFVFAETRLKEKSPGYTAVRTKEFKYIETQPWRLTFHMSVPQIRSWVGWLINRPRFLYRLTGDESEKVNLIKAERETAGRFHSVVRGVVTKNRDLARGIQREKKPKIEMEDDVVKQLEALGYFER